MNRREYKTVAMPALVKGRRRRRQSRAEMVAEIVSGVINKQAAQGWSYVRADTFRTPERRTWFHRSEEIEYTVLVFERAIADGAAAAPAAASLAEPAEPTKALPPPSPSSSSPSSTADAESAVRRRESGESRGAEGRSSIAPITADLFDRAAWAKRLTRQSDPAPADSLGAKMKGAVDGLVSRVRRAGL